MKRSVWEKYDVLVIYISNGKYHLVTYRTFIDNGDVWETIVNLGIEAGIFFLMRTLIVCRVLSGVFFCNIKCTTLRTITVFFINKISQCYAIEPILHVILKWAIFLQLENVNLSGYLLVIFVTDWKLFTDWKLVYYPVFCLKVWTNSLENRKYDCML